MSAPDRRERRLFALLIRLMAAACLAVTFALVKIAADRGVHVIESLFYRQLFALPVVIAALALGPGFACLRTRHPGAHVTRTAVGMVGMIFNFLGVLMLPLAEATTIGFTAPIFATIMSALFLQERTGLHRWGAVAMGFAGMLVMVQPDGDHFPLFGGSIALIGAFMTACVSILLRQLSRTEDPLAIVFWFCIFSLVPLGIGMLIYGHAHDAVSWGLLALIGVAGGLGQICLTVSLKWAPISVVMPMDYSSLIWASLFGWFFWSTWPGPATWVGAGLIVASGLYIAWRERVRRNPVDPEPLAIDQI